MTCQIEFININKFAEVILNENIKVFVAYINSLAAKITFYLVKKAQISLLLVEKITIPAEYLDFANIFLTKLFKIVLN